MTQEHTEHDAKVRDFFDGHVAAYDAFYDSPSRFQRAFNKVFRKAVYLRRNHTITLARRFGCKTILDVGCGTGQNSIWFAHHGVERVFGIDLSAEMVTEARALAERAGASKQCEFQYSDFSSLESDQKYDMVIALGVLDYVQASSEFLQRMARSAKRVIYASFPSWTIVRSPLRKIRYAVRGCPTHFCRRAEVERLLKGTEFGPTETLPMPSGCLGWASRV